MAVKRKKEKSKGCARIKALDVTSEGLTVRPDEPPLHHANIEGWPSSDDPLKQREAQLALAKRLVEHAQLALW